MEPRQVLKGHTENVCTLNVNSSGHIVSGSWDKKVIVWKNFQKAYEIEGHDAAVWAVLMVEEDLILSASADKLIKLWKNGRLVRVFEGHTDAVRGLALIPGTGFVSCSNDGSLRVWNMDGKCLQELYGHTSFVYSVAVLSSGELLSAGEDRTVKIWKDGECIQTLQQPCVSVWAVTGLPNNDIVEFEDLLASQVISSNQLGDINKDKLPGPEALHNPGKKEGQAIMINTGASVEAYQWVSQGWQKIGEVIGGAGQGTKQTFDGKEYDYVFDIDVGNGPGGNLKLPYNTTQNPYDAAEKFLVHHNLSPSFKDQVADFIISNSREVNSGNTYQDPFTGGSRYTPGATTSHSSDNYMDPFTGQGAYRPGQNNPVASTPSYNDPFTGNSSYKSPASAESQKVKVLPVRTYLFLKQAVPEAVFNKIKALNKELTSIKLTEEELTALTKIITFLKTPSGMSLDGSGLLIVIKMCQEWPVDKRFPALDLLRLITFYAPEELASAVPSRDVVNFIRHVGGLNVTDSNETNAMLSYRALANLFHEEIGREILWGKRDVLSELLQVDISAKYKGKNIRLAESTLAVK
ncbi:WD40-repeat-containing domain protein [Pilobolus umbonatus]|nr:WD40-repeat-containing domain protein [Pilobolus umbonatus]